MYSTSSKCGDMQATMAACMESMGSLLAASSGNASAANTDSDTEACYIIQTLWHGYAAYNALT